MYNALKERVKRSASIYDAYLFVRTRIRWIDYVRRGRPVPPPHFVKQRCVLSNRKRFGLDVLIETGTHRGEMVWCVRSAFKEIYSIELDDELYQGARRLFAAFPHIFFLQGDSATVLGDLLEHIRQPCLFWLDAHYSGVGTARGVRETPILAELSHIFGHAINGHVILIDDARCFDGRSDYPSLSALKQYVLEHRPGWSFSVADDIIRITPPE